jgi:hypothetical protein
MSEVTVKQGTMMPRAIPGLEGGFSKLGTTPGGGSRAGMFKSSSRKEDMLAMLSHMMCFKPAGIVVWDAWLAQILRCCSTPAHTVAHPHD